MQSLRLLVLAVWALIHPAAPHLRDAEPIADAIARAVDTAGALPWSREETTAVMAYYAMRESWLNAHAVGDGGRSCGPWQIRCDLVRRIGMDAPLDEQARIWLSLVRASSLGAVDSSPARAARRRRRALDLLAEARRAAHS
jgi:hypothetical protein